MRIRSPVVHVAAVVTASGLLLSACATEDYVNMHVGAVNMRVDETNARVSALDQRVGTVEQRVGAAEQAAANAQKTADAAAIAAKGHFNDQVMDQQSVLFDTAKWKLSPEAQMTLTALASKLKDANQNVFIEIIGHADKRGGAEFNLRLGARRALAVRKFLVDQGVPLNRTEILSWGLERPKEQGRSPEALQANRRVDLIVKG